MRVGYENGGGFSKCLDGDFLAYILQTLGQKGNLQLNSFPSLFVPLENLEMSGVFMFNSVSRSDYDFAENEKNNEQIIHARQYKLQENTTPLPIANRAIPDEAKQYPNQILNGNYNCPSIEI